MHDFTDILAALVILIAIGGLIFFPAAALHIRKTRKELEQARAFNLDLMQDIGRESFENLKLRVEAKGLKDQNQKLLQEIEERKALPLRGITDEELLEVIREELTYRVEHRCLLEYAFGPSDDPIWKIASKVGGAAFRVVDKAKRGKLEVQQ